MTKAKSTSGGRFDKGQSGNPKGRPRKPPEPAAPAISVVIDRTLTITRGGQAREVTMEEALQHRTYQDAIAGKRLAQREVLKWIRKREAWLGKQAGGSLRREVIRKMSPDPTNANAALQLLGIAVVDERWLSGDRDQVRLMLEPWAVHVALARRRSSAPLCERDVAEIRRCTSRPESLRWPKGTPT